MSITTLLDLTMLLQGCVASQQSSLCVCCVRAQPHDPDDAAYEDNCEPAHGMTSAVVPSSSSPFYLLLTRWYIFCQTWLNGVQWNRQVMLPLKQLCWLFNQDWKAPTPAGCSSILILPSPNQDKTLHISKTTQVVLMPRTLQCLYSASHTREQECHFKNIFFCCQAAGASKQFLAACTFMQLDACVFRVYTSMFVSGSLQ